MSRNINCLHNQMKECIKTTDKLEIELSKKVNFIVTRTGHVRERHDSRKYEFFLNKRVLEMLTVMFVSVMF